MSHPAKKHFMREIQRINRELAELIEKLEIPLSTRKEAIREGLRDVFFTFLNLEEKPFPHSETGDFFFDPSYGDDELTISIDFDADNDFKIDDKKQKAWKLCEVIAKYDRYIEEIDDPYPDTCYFFIRLKP